MENATQTTGKQNRLARELENRATAQRPQAWRPPELLPKIGRAHV